MLQLGYKISAYRQNAHMTQEELAAKLGVSPQAVSKWEREQSYPDIITFANMCKILNISSDLLLRTGCDRFAENGDTAIGNELVKKSLRDCEEPLALQFGEKLLDLFIEDSYTQYIHEQRLALTWEGLLVPTIRIRDDLRLKPNEFMVLSYHRVLYNEVIETIDKDTLPYILEKTVNTIRTNYGYILNRDMVRNIVNNLKAEYPALITGIVPDIISYSMLQKVMIGLLERGDGLCYMIKTIEVMEDVLRKDPAAEACELINAVTKEIEREDNYWVMMAKRK